MVELIAEQNLERKVSPGSPPMDNDEEDFDGDRNERYKIYISCPYGKNKLPGVTIELFPNELSFLLRDFLRMSIVHNETFVSEWEEEQVDDDLVREINERRLRLTGYDSEKDMLRDIKEALSSGSPLVFRYFFSLEDNDFSEIEHVNLGYRISDLKFKKEFGDNILYMCVKKPRNKDDFTQVL